MVDLSEELNQLAGLPELAGPAVGAVLAGAGWEGEHRDPSKSWATVWNREGARAGVRGEGPVGVEFTLWFREIDDDSAYDEDYIDGLHATAVTELLGCVAQLESSVLADRLVPTGDDLTEGEDFVDHRAWRLSGRALLAGVKHEDTELPVRVVIAFRDETAEGAAQDDADGEWL